MSLARVLVVSLAADLDSSPDNLANLSSPPTLFYALAANVEQTVFDGFTLFHKQEAAAATLEQADAQIRSTVISAFSNVADLLRPLQADARSLNGIRHPPGYQNSSQSFLAVSNNRSIWSW